MHSRFRSCALALLLLGGNGEAAEWSGWFEGELRYFIDPPQFPAQDEQRLQPSLAARPELYHAWDRGDQALLFVPFLRLDSVDEQRTHADLRELSYLRVFDSWELLAGVSKVFWGVTESQHLIDIVNQTDLVEDIRGEDKLGQPMVKLTWLRNWGVLKGFVLPGFRERSFPGPEGRLRTALPVDTDNPIYESDREQRHIDLALRWEHSLGNWDLGLAYFTGTSRDPSFVPGRNDAGEPVLFPRYDLIDQVSIDALVLVGDWTWKLEALGRDSNAEEQSYFAWVGGFEYTFFGKIAQRGDIGLLAEYNYDDRGKEALTPFDNDLFVATRLTNNDEWGSELLAGFFIDMDTSSTSFWLRGARRLTNRWYLSVQARGFSNVDSEGFLGSLRNDSFLEANLLWYL